MNAATGSTVTLDDFDGLYRQYEQAIFSFTYNVMGKDAADAADITQDTFVKLYRALPGLAPDSNIPAWLHRVAMNACLDVLRRRQRLRWLPWELHKHEHLLSSPPADDPEQAVISHETRVTVQRVLAAMIWRHRQALILREWQQMNCQEIGETMGLSRSAVKSLLFRAREAFRRVYASIEPKVAA
jgi:RNA polymerase sigma-70 factor, ECF subfamily